MRFGEFAVHDVEKRTQAIDVGASPLCCTSALYQPAGSDALQHTAQRTCLARGVLSLHALDKPRHRVRGHLEYTIQQQLSIAGVCDFAYLQLQLLIQLDGSFYAFAI